MKSIQLISRSESDTEQIGRAMAQVVPAGCVIGLIGTLGAGKTRFVQAFASACGIDRATVVSPTFVLCNEYMGEKSLYHFDAYRLPVSSPLKLESPDGSICELSEFKKLGVDDYFASNGISLIEWADRVLDELPSDRIEIRIEIGDDDRRIFRIESIGDRYSSVIRQLHELSQAWQSKQTTK